MTPRYALMIAVVLGPFGCDPDPARGPRPEVAARSSAAAAAPWQPAGAAPRRAAALESLPTAPGPAAAVAG